MPVYTYKAKNESGKLFAGETKIASESDLISLLVEKGYTPVEIKVKNAFTDISTISFLKPKVKIKDLAVFCRQFAIVIEAGVPLSAALEVIRDQTQNRTLKECINDVYENIQKGSSLTNAMKQHAEIFPEILINMVEAGEVSGQLDRVFIRMADHYEKEFKLNHKIKSAMTYPVIVCIVAVILVFVMMTFVLPQFTQVLVSFNAELPLPTKILIKISNIFKSYWVIMLILLFAIFAYIKYFTRTYTGKMFFSRLSIKLPIIRRVTKYIITARFTRTLGTLVASGVLLIQALEVVQKVLGNALVSEKMEIVIEEIKKGRGLTSPLSSMGYFPPMLISMVRIGEESGELDFALNKSADFYDQEVETSTQQLTTLLEPIIIILLAVVVGFIILSILYPMFNVYKALSE
ncbi:MAG: type II secretion system F family protein [Clostridia bacterium]|nr:type II secretion system F family protein [Clostridia bacterium]